MNLGAKTVQINRWFLNTKSANKDKDDRKKVMDATNDVSR